jgi:methylase of polypeptide subunit release factors
MPRLPPALLRQARAVSPHLRTLLPACRDLESARNELRWIREHVAATAAAAAASTSSPSSSSSPSPSHHHHHHHPSPPAADKHSHDRRHRHLHGHHCQCGHDHSLEEQQEHTVAELCARRARGEPLQYILGSQPFGPLDIRCEPGVLIPRPETEAWTYRLAAQLPALVRAGRGPKDEQESQPLRILDWCTGSGCVALLLAVLARQGAGAEPRVLGLDFSDAAVGLARRNLAANAGRIVLLSGTSPSASSAVRFERADIFDEVDWRAHLGPDGGLPEEEGTTRQSKTNETAAGGYGQDGFVDVLVANPPYISQRGFDRDTARSVRNYEPRLALQPLAAITNNLSAASTTAPEEKQPAERRPWEYYYDCRPEDVFYARLFDLAGSPLGPAVMLFEVGDLAQAVRVARMAERLLPSAGAAADWHVEIWRDEPDQEELETMPDVVVWGRPLPVRGSGHGRSVLVYNGVQAGSKS